MTWYAFVVSLGIFLSNILLRYVYLKGHGLKLIKVSMDVFISLVKTTTYNQRTHFQRLIPIIPFVLAAMLDLRLLEGFNSM